MKYFNFLFFLLPFCFSSCEQEETDANNDDYYCQVYQYPDDIEHEIIGCWRLIDWYTDEPIQVNLQSPYTTEVFEHWNGCFKESVLIFSGNQTTKIHYLGESQNENCPYGTVPGQYYSMPNWKVEETNGSDYLKLYTSSNNYQLSKIIELTDDRLVIENIIEITGSIEGYLVFERP